jgi:hypothetical protein
MEMPLNVLFWAMEAAYIIHCLDETIIGGGFVNMLQRDFWPEYSRKKFFWFNTILHIINITGIILYEVLGGAWVIFPLSLSWLFVTNGLWHLIGTIISREYSPGLLTTPLYWIIMYFIVRYSLLPGNIPLSHFVVSVVIGTMLTILMIGSLLVLKRRGRKQESPA